MDILIVEDDTITRSLLRRMLESAGHRVLEAGDGHAAWQVLQARNLKMVVTDWMMPEMDGLELCRAIRGRKTGDYVFVIVLTTNDAKADIIKGLEAGADDYLCKPFHQAELVARINTGLRILKLEASLRKATEEIRQLSIADSLTGCFNRRYLDEHLPQEIKRAVRYGQALSLIIADIDHFKHINDRWGHLFGDRVLAEVGRLLRTSIRDGIDWVCRYGGEEFLVVLPETGSRGAGRTAERLRREIAALAFTEKGQTVQVTASFGVFGAALMESDSPAAADDMLRQADKRLYQAKAAGRNRVCDTGSATDQSGEGF